ncbi:hypothetical protein BDR26DRAFT_857862 [Obelidium mucronatum]|nr:hypothetical protein BDR26DRAFT_857862 [Obelidium mucronatum]
MSHSFDQALATLQESIHRDAFLREANFESFIVASSLVNHKNNVAETIKALTNCAKWHEKILGHQSKRVSILHIHAFLLTEIDTFLPTAKDSEGRPIIVIRPGKISNAIPKQHYANFTMWSNFWLGRSFVDNNHSVFIDLEGFKLKQFRPSQYKCIEEASACCTSLPNDSTLYVLNASKTTTRLWNTILRIIKSVSYPKVHFIKPEELSNFMDVSQIPVDMGGLRSAEDTRADMEEFIREEYAREGLLYEPIDIKHYQLEDLQESAMSVASNVDFD